MPDWAQSKNCEVQVQIDRLASLTRRGDSLGLNRIQHLLEKLGNPELSIPPVFHVAGTNGKGSTCAFLRAAFEAEGMNCHVFSSPHLVQLNERIRVAGSLISNEALASLLEEVIDEAGTFGPTFFEVITATAFLAFARAKADVCLIEVGLGGRLDATNVIPQPAVCGIAQLGMDHQDFLGDSLEAIATEKAGIAKRGSPLVTMRYPEPVAASVADLAHTLGVVPQAEGTSWHWLPNDRKLHYWDAEGDFDVPLPTLCGPHQHANLALAIAMLRFSRTFDIKVDSFKSAALTARWPARMQRLSKGPVTKRTKHAEVWLDGAHNGAAATVISETIRKIAQGRPVHLIVGILSSKEAADVISKFSFAQNLVGIPVPFHEHYAPEHLAALGQAVGIGSVFAADNLWQALQCLTFAENGIILIMGSLYLAGMVLEANLEAPA